MAGPWASKIGPPGNHKSCVPERKTQQEMEVFERDRHSGESSDFISLQQENALGL